jgi:hypothetical protein
MRNRKYPTVDACLPPNSHAHSYTNTHSAQWRASSARVGVDVSQSITSALERRLGHATGAAVQWGARAGAGEGTEGGESSDDEEVEEVFGTLASARWVSQSSKCQVSKCID